MPEPDTFAALPDPGRAGSLDELVDRLRLLKVWAGDPSYETIKDRVNAAWTVAGRPAAELTRRSTVANCFQPARRRMNTDLVLAVVEALHPDPEYVALWRRALRVLGGGIEAGARVRVYGSLPGDLAGFTGRVAELDRLQGARQAGDAVVISAIAGMAGVGKTQLAVHAGHRLHRQEPFDRVLFVNLRGFHADASQPPADPAAVLDGFLRLLGVPAHRIPAGLAARVAAYRDRLVGVRALVVLDNAADAEQVRPLLPATPGCLTLVTSRRGLDGLDAPTRLAVDVFTPDEAVAFLATAVPDTPVGTDPHARARIAERCGHLPLALSLIAGRVRDTPGWTLTDHADRLDERHGDRRLDSGVELAFDVSYRHLPAGPRRLLRRLALHPGQDFDAYAAAALVDTDLSTAQTWLGHLHGDHLLQAAGRDRYTFHDLVRDYATTRAQDEDRRSERHAALTRLFDHYLATAAAAMGALYPAEADRRLPIAPSTTPAPDLVGQEAAVAWLDTELPALVAVAAHGATNGWERHTTRLARTLFRYLTGVSHTDAMTVHGHALTAARRAGDLDAQGWALNDLGFIRMRLSQIEPAKEHYQEALRLFRETGDLLGQARSLHNLGGAATWSSHNQVAVDHLGRAIALYRQGGDRSGEVQSLLALAKTLQDIGRRSEALDHCREALTRARQIGDRGREATALNIIGDIEVRSGRYGPAADHIAQAMTLYRQMGNRRSEAGAFDSLGKLHLALGRPDRATDCYRQGLTMFRELGNRPGETEVLIGLGEAARAAGRADEAVGHHTAAYAIAEDTGDAAYCAHADTGLGQDHQALGDPAGARRHYERALAVYTAHGLPEAEQVREYLADLRE